MAEAGWEGEAQVLSQKACLSFYWTPFDSDHYDVLLDTLRNLTSQPFIPKAIFPQLRQWGHWKDLLCPAVLRPTGAPDPIGWQRAALHIMKDSCLRDSTSMFPMARAIIARGNLQWGIEAPARTARILEHHRLH